MPIVPQVAAALQRVLTMEADAAARATGCVRRTRKFTGATLLQTLVFGWLANPAASLDELCQAAAACGVRVTPQALAERFTSALAACLHRVLAAAVAQVLTADPLAVPLFQRFTAVVLLDSTTITLPAALAEQWRGCGGRPGEGTAALKAHVALDLRAGGLTGPLLDHGRAQDRTAPTQTMPLAAGALRIADLGYFDLGVLAAYAAAGVYWLTRLRTGTVVADAAGQRLELGALLAGQGPSVLDQPVRLGGRERLPARLLAERVPAAVAAERRRKLHQAARRKGQPVSQARLALADWTILVTNTPVALLSLPEALVLARARWQIELLFKLWKADGQVAVWRSSQPARILCEVYAKLLAVVIQHWLLLTGAGAADRSLRKAAKAVRHAALGLALLFHHADLLLVLLAHLARVTAGGGRTGTRRRAPAAHQLWAAPAVGALS